AISQRNLSNTSGIPGLFVIGEVGLNRPRTNGTWPNRESLHCGILALSRRSRQPNGKVEQVTVPRLHGGNRADCAACTIPGCAFGSGYYSQNGTSRLPHTCRSASRRIYLVVQPTAYCPDIASTGGFRHHR